MKFFAACTRINEQSHDFYEGLGWLTEFRERRISLPLEKWDIGKTLRSGLGSFLLSEGRYEINKLMRGKHSVDFLNFV